MLIAALVPPKGIPIDPKSSEGCVFSKFGIKETSNTEECGITCTKNVLVGCTAKRIHSSPHACMPHLETISHVLEGSSFEPSVKFTVASKSISIKRPISVQDVLACGENEACIFLRIVAKPLGEFPDETYPVGKPTDKVISRALLIEAASSTSFPTKSQKMGKLSLLLHVVEDETDFSSTYEGGEWPYFTTQALSAMLADDVLFDSNGISLGPIAHLRTNLPSIERSESQGGMWNHSLFFGVDAFRRIDWLKNNTIFDENGRIKRKHQRTIGELFYIPSSIEVGFYILLCPYLPLHGDVSPTVPLLYNW